LFEYIDGKRMSLNVEKVGENLMVQHYVEDISEREYKWKKIYPTHTSGFRIILGLMLLPKSDVGKDAVTKRCVMQLSFMYCNTDEVCII
jgi:hypothetical protein